MPTVLKLVELLGIERDVVQKSIWILDSVESSFEISLGDFLEVVLQNLGRCVEYKWILPNGVVAQDYWHKLGDTIRSRIADPNLLSNFQVRFLPPEILNAMSDFVIYDAKTIKRGCYIGILQGGEYWHFKTEQYATTQLVEGFEFLWSLPQEIHSLITVYASGIDELSCFLPEGLLPEDITQNINDNYQEIMRVYRVGCNTAAIALCGRLIETILHALYEKLEKRSPDKNWGMDALGSRIKKHGIFLPALSEQFSLIKKFRNRAVHG